MKHIKTITKSISLVLIFSCFAVNLYANNSQHSDINPEIQIVLPNNNNINVAPANTPESCKQDIQIDSLMLKKDSKTIRKNKINEESIKKPSISEDTMINIESDKTPCSNTQSDISEKEWVNEHSFMIL